MAQLHAVSARLASGEELPALLQEVMDGAIMLTRSDKGTLQLYDEQTDSLRIVSQRGFERPFLDHFAVVHDGPAVCGEALRLRERVIVEDVLQSPIFRGTPTMAVMEEASVRAVQSTPMVSRKGRLLGMIATHWTRPHRPDEERLRCLDLLARNAADLIDLEKALRTRDDFLSIAAHELKTPITSLRIQLQMMEQLAEEGSEPIPRVAVIKTAKGCIRELDRLTRIVSDMVDVAVVSGGVLSLDRDRMDVGSLVRSVVERLGGALAFAGCEARVEAQPGVIAWLDGFRIEQVVTNLLTNVMKYAADQPVEIKVSARGEEVVITVADHGVGISKQAQARVFEQFFRAVPHTNVSGFGLGLYIAHQIVRLHGGRIELQSEEGAGSTFTVTLPLGDGCAPPSRH